jgi:ferredoxin
MIRIEVDRELCELHGQCVFTAPDLFHIDDDGVLHHAEQAPEEYRRLAEEAASICPAAAITIS